MVILVCPCDQVGIIGGSGLDDPDILDDRREIYRETPYGMVSRQWSTFLARIFNII